MSACHATAPPVRTQSESISFASVVSNICFFFCSCQQRLLPVQKGRPGRENAHDFSARDADALCREKSITVRSNNRNNQQEKVRKHFRDTDSSLASKNETKNEELALASSFPTQAHMPPRKNTRVYGGRPCPHSTYVYW